MDHADPPRAGSLEPLHDSLAGTDAGLGENYTMNAHRTSTEMVGELPPSPAPRTKRGRLHKSLDTPNGAGLGHLQFVNASGGEDVAP
jgi:hypothetical protein